MVELIAQRFRVLAEPMRIKLLDQLREGPSTVQRLTETTGASQQNASKHLQVLHAAGMVTRAKRGNFVSYEIADPSVFELCEMVCGGIHRQIDALNAALPAAEASR